MLHCNRQDRLQNKLINLIKKKNIAPSRNTREFETQQQDLRKNSNSAGIRKGKESKEKQTLGGKKYIGYQEV